ncbi:TPR-like protein [Metschnikowia bicuspidata var. bicuspidata NRRL YB-4993]|uniref:TPR-like protein n=1 Tax=Metschnikowia bicuspidata var. bicuspidata NRRL YB-4993 TaxID=869754 RepID=A0A1A0HHE3_9ASCO|nr:TPR-like protein [Metschnikowia bicuspidata var. bicuspidata NRRL YB-4993]OBA23421.1 TPR-like protein [Metschnikowia bicuspidata var. bicuspidata NRRL YB-4993]
MVQPQKTPLQHNSTLFISPQIGSRRQNVFITPPNPHNNLFETPGTLLSLFYDPDNISGHLHEPGNAAQPSDEPLSRVEKLRLWRHDALMQHHYDTAEYIGDKILSLTSDPNDAFWLAQVHFNRGNFLRAHKLLSSSPEYEQSLSCRYLSAYSLVKLERWDDAMDLLGESNPFKDSNYKVRSTDGGTRLEASMCYLRGVVYANQSNYEKAQEAYKEAVMVDVKCFEAFNELISNDYLSPKEQWEFINQLNYADADDNDELIKLLYTTRLSKYMNISKFEEAESILREEYRLGSNADVVLSRADYLYIKCNYDECLKLCEKVLDRDPYNFSLLPNYLSCLYELGGRNKLFLKAHQLADNHPSHPLTWLAIGIYYLSIHKTLEARKFFSKATLLNPNSGQGWIGFGHTFALEGEHEQAISAYAFAARLFPGTHLPNLFLGMQHLQMNSINLSEEYLLASYQICNTDPLLLNEMGVIQYHKNSLQKAEALFQEALGAAKYLNSDSKTWISIHSNLGHVFRRSNHPYEALDCFNQALKLSPQSDSNILSSVGLVYMKLGNDHKAIQVLHDALALAPSDPVAQDLLKRALQTNKNSPLFLSQMDSKISDIHISARKLKSQDADRLKGDILADSTSFGNRFATPLTRKVRNFPEAPSKCNITQDGSIEAIAEKLKRGEASSDEEIMDIESD